MESSPPMAAKNDDLVSEHPINSSDVELVKRPKLRFVGNVVIQICADGERSRKFQIIERALFCMPIIDRDHPAHPDLTDKKLRADVE